MEKKGSRLAVLVKGIIKENPNLVLLLGTCPTLATTSSAFNGIDLFQHRNFAAGENYSG